jgi:hypothetical protein
MAWSHYYKAESPQGKEYQMNQEVIYDETPERKYSVKVIALGIATAIVSAIVTSSLLPSTVTASGSGVSSSSSNIISTPSTQNIPGTTANPSANLTSVKFAGGSDD